jgi:glycosyltransferase involved in cell wall biosynthesis
MKKIAFVAEYIAPPGRPRTGGLESLTYNLAKCLSTRFDVHIVTSYLEHSERNEVRDNLIVHRVGLERKEIQRGDFINRILYNISVNAELTSLRPDLVIAVGFVSWNGAYKAAKKLNIPVIATVLEVWQGDWIKNVGFSTGVVGEILERIYLRKTYDRYIAISQFTGDRLAEKIKIPKEKISIVYCGVDLKEISSVSSSGKFPSPTIITICRLVEYKGVQDIIKAVALVKSEIPGINLIIVGEGSYKPVLEKLVLENNLRENVKFYGKIKRNEDLILLLKQSHIFVLGSTVEGFGMVIVEAMASGIPYIAADIPAVREITDGGVGGFLVPSNSPEEISKCIQAINTDPRLYAKLQEDGAMLVRRYDWKNICRSLNGIINELIN